MKDIKYIIIGNFLCAIIILLNFFHIEKLSDYWKIFLKLLFKSPLIISFIVSDIVILILLLIFILTDKIVISKKISKFLKYVKIIISLFLSIVLPLCIYIFMSFPG